MEKINVKLCSLHLEYSPQRKIQLLLKTCKIIYDSMAVSSPGHNPLCQKRKYSQMYTFHQNERLNTDPIENELWTNPLTFRAGPRC